MQQTTTSFMFVGKQHGKAEEAIHFYVSLFKNSRIVNIVRYGAGEGEPVRARLTLQLGEMVDFV